MCLVAVRACSRWAALHSLCRSAGQVGKARWKASHHADATAGAFFSKPRARSSHRHPRIPTPQCPTSFAHFMAGQADDALLSVRTALRHLSEAQDAAQSEAAAEDLLATLKVHLAEEESFGAHMAACLCF